MSEPEKICFCRIPESEKGRTARKQARYDLRDGERSDLDLDQSLLDPESSELERWEEGQWR